MSAVATAAEVLRTYRDAAILWYRVGQVGRHLDAMETRYPAQPMSGADERHLVRAIQHSRALIARYAASGHADPVILARARRTSARLEASLVLSRQRARR